MNTLSLAPKEQEIQLTGVASGGISFHEMLVPPANGRKRELVYPQKPGMGKPVRVITLFDGRFLEWRERNGRKERVRALNLAFLSPTPQRRRKIAWEALLATLMAAGCGVIAGVMAAWPGVAIAVAVASVGLWLAISNSEDRLVFYSRHGRVALFELHNQRADRVRFEKLLNVIAKRSQKQWQELPAGKERLAAEVAEHRRLMEEGVLPVAAYESAKQRIFRQYKN